MLDALTERISELEARHKRDAREIELLRAEVDSKNLEIAAKEADIKLKDMELAEAERTVGSKGLLIESLQAELEETKANLEHAQLETMTLENGLDFVKAVQVCVCVRSHTCTSSTRAHVYTFIHMHVQESRRASSTISRSESDGFAQYGTNTKSESKDAGVQTGRSEESDTLALQGRDDESAQQTQAQAEVMRLTAIIAQLNEQAVGQDASGADNPRRIVPYAPPQVGFQKLHLSMNLNESGNALPASCPVAPAVDDLSGWLDGGNNSPPRKTQRDPEQSTERTMNGRFQMLSPSHSPMKGVRISQRNSSWGRRSKSRRVSETTLDRAPTLDLLQLDLLLASLERDQEEAGCDSEYTSDASAGSRHGGAAVTAGSPEKWHWEKESLQSSPRERLKSDVESDWSDTPPTPSGVNSPQWSRRSSRRRRMVVKKQPLPRFTPDEEEALLHLTGSGGLLKRSNSENNIKELQKEWELLLHSPRSGRGLGMGSKGRRSQLQFAGQGSRPSLTQSHSTGDLLPLSALKTNALSSPADRISRRRTPRFCSVPLAAKTRSPLQALVAQIELRRVLVREQEEQLRRKEQKLFSAYSSCSGYNSDSIATCHSAKHELKQMREELAERTKLDMRTLEQELLDCTYEMEQALEYETENVEKLKLEVQCLESKVRQERLDRQVADVQIREARTNLDLLAQQLESTVKALGDAREKQDALLLERDYLANRLDAAEQDSKRKIDFWSWERDAMLAKLCEQTRASESYVVPIEHALMMLQSATTDGIATLKVQHEIQYELQMQVQALTEQLRTHRETSLADSKALETVHSLEQQLRNTEMVHEQELNSLREIHRTELEEQRLQRRTVADERERGLARELDDKVLQLENVRKQMIILEDDHLEAMSAAANAHRRDMAKLRDELWESFLKLKRNNEVTLCLFDTVSDIADQTREAGNSICDIIAGEEEMADVFLHFEDSCALSRDVMQRKIDALAYCLKQLEHEYSGGSRMYEKLMHACSNMEITRPDGAASSPECARACFSCADEYLCMLKQSFKQLLDAPVHHAQTLDCSWASSAHSSSTACDGRGGGEQVAQQGPAWAAPGTPKSGGPNATTFSLGWWKEDGPRLPLALLSPRDPSTLQGGGDILAEQFSEKLIFKCMEKLESKLAGSGVSDRAAAAGGHGEGTTVPPKSHAVELAAASRNVEVAGHVIKALALLTNVQAVSRELVVEIEALSRAVPKVVYPHEFTTNWHSNSDKLRKTQKLANTYTISTTSLRPACCLLAYLHAHVCIRMGTEQTAKNGL